MESGPPVINELCDLHPISLLVTVQPLGRCPSGGLTCSLLPRMVIPMGLGCSSIQQIGLELTLKSGHHLTYAQCKLTEEGTEDTLNLSGNQYSFSIWKSTTRV